METLILLGINIILTIISIILTARVRVIKVPAGGSDKHDGIMVMSPQGLHKVERNRAQGGVVDNSDEGLWQREDGQQS